jgi:hypothetical protein
LVVQGILMSQLLAVVHQAVKVLATVVAVVVVAHL